MDAVHACHMTTQHEIQVKQHDMVVTKREMSIAQHDMHIAQYNTSVLHLCAGHEGKQNSFGAASVSAGAR